MMNGKTPHDIMRARIAARFAGARPVELAPIEPTDFFAGAFNPVAPGYGEPADAPDRAEHADAPWPGGVARENGQAEAAVVKDQPPTEQQRQGDATIASHRAARGGA